MALRQKAIVTLFMLLMASTLKAQIQVQSEEIKSKGNQVFYDYSLAASDMIEGKKFPADAKLVENAACHKDRGTVFISADSGASEATIVYEFDFTQTQYRPTSVDWQYALNLFGKPGPNRAKVIATVAWSLDGKIYNTITQESNDPEYILPRGIKSVPNGKTIKFEHTPDKVYYRVQFKTDKPEEKFQGAQAQWNRSGTNAKMFHARFNLMPLADSVIKDHVSLQVTYPEKVAHISGTQVYPEYIFNMDSAKHWKFLGATHGTKGGVELVDSPGRPGEKALLFSVKINKNKNTPSWMYWQAVLKPELSIVGTYETEFDLYPVTKMPFRIMTMYGNHHGFGIIPATWSPLGNHEPGKWHKIKINVGIQRRDIDVIRFTFPTRPAEVTDGVEVKFIIDNIRMTKLADPIAVRTIDKMSVHSGIEAGFMQMLNPTELVDDDPMKMAMELSVLKDQKATLTIDVVNKETKQSTHNELPVTLKAPFTELQVSLLHLMADTGAGNHQLTYAIHDVHGKVLATSSKPHDFIFYSEAHMHQQRKQLLARLRQLQDRKDQLQDKGIVVGEPNVTLTVCDWFLNDEGNVVDDFVRQRACGIAYEQMDYLKGLLDVAEKQLTLREQGTVKEAKVDDYQVGVPVQIADGRFIQSGKPIFLIGALGSTTHAHLLKDIGFNSQSRETGINRWIAQTQDRGVEQLKAVFDTSRKFGISSTMLLSSHYKPTMYGKFEGADSPHTGASMFPWDVLHPHVDELFDLWYQRMMPYLKNEPTLVSLGTANEPGYQVDKESKTFEAAFRVWAREQYGTIDVANQLWGSSFASFDDLNSPDFFVYREKSQAANYDWLRFVDEKISAFFQRRKEYLLKEMPGMTVWVKLMGNHKHIGFGHLNEITNILKGQNVAGTDGHIPIWLDLIKSINPDLPIVNSEWHFLGGSIDMNDQQLIQRRMVDGMTHGICNGLIWKWHRSEWDTKSNGAEQTLTRWARTIDVAGRTALKMRGLVEPISEMGNLDGGKVRLLYSISSTVKMGKDYALQMQDVYDSIGRNALGTRLLISNHMTASQLEGVTLIAAGPTPNVETSALAMIEQWVKNGGTLWLTEPTMQRDPWDRQHADLPAAFVSAMNTQGKHAYGKGQIVVSEDDAIVASHCTGPWAVNDQGQYNRQIDIRYLKPQNGQPGYLSILNRDSEPTTIKLVDDKGSWNAASKAYDVWNYEDVDLNQPLELPANGVMIIKM